LPDLETKLYELEQDQTRDVRGALFDKGKYVLSKQEAVLKVSYETWTIPQVTMIAPKPGQRKRTKNCKTVTALSKKLKF
jgi:hypothetical protein